MKAILLDRPGSPNTLRSGEAEIPSLQAGEVLVKVSAAGLNPVDYKVAASGMEDWQYPFILGVDVAGIVEAVGEEVWEWKPGDRVYYHGSIAKPGAYTEYNVAPSHVLASIPENLSFTQAAAIPCAGFTAYQALHRKIGIKQGQTILVQGGSGAVGGFAIQIAKVASLTVIATCSEQNIDYVKQLGADYAIDYHDGDVAAKVKEITQGRGVDVVIDPVSSQTATAGLKMLAFNGHLAHIAGAPDYSQIETFAKAPSVHAIALAGAYLADDLHTQQDFARMGKELGQLVSEGKVDPMLSETITLTEIPDTLQRLANGNVRGKVVARIA